MPRPREFTLALSRVALLGVASAMYVASVACSAGPSQEALAPDEILFSESPPLWFEAYFTDLEVTPDGRMAVYNFRRLLDLTKDSESTFVGDLEELSGLDVFRGTFDHTGKLLVLGRRGEQGGWFRIAGVGREAEAATGDGAFPPTLLESLPPGATPEWSPSGDRIAYRVNRDTAALFVGPLGEEVPHRLPGRITGFAWTPDSGTILVLVVDTSGESTLHALDPRTGEVRAVAERLDAPTRSAKLAVSDDGRFAYLALAGDDAPDLEARHDPDADRDLDIYEIDLGTGDRRAVVETPAEELAPAFGGGALHWVAIQTHMEAVLVPIDGGEARVIAEDVQGPTWRPDGRAIGVTTGNWRTADWALNLDGGRVELDAEGRPTSDVVPMITGYHEDFSPVWSPDGRWIAYHSHRSAGPVTAYRSEGSTDDIYLRRTDAPTSEEIRLTDFGIEVGTPDWSADGRRLLFDSWDPGGGASAWIVEIDSETGAVVDRKRVPVPDAANGSPSMGAWSPTRDEIALVLRGAEGTEDAELWVLAPDGSSGRRIAAYEMSTYGGADWTADGESLVYSALSGGRLSLFVVSRSGGDPRPITDDPANLLHPQVSPDGRWVAATRLRHEKRVLRRPGPP